MSPESPDDSSTIPKVGDNRSKDDQLSEWLRTAVEHHRQNKLQEAEAIYRQILGEDPNHADALHLLGVLVFQAGNDQAGIELITRAIARNRLDPFYHNNLGNIFKKLGKLPAATGCYEEALRLKPRYAEAHYNLATVFRDQGDLERATQHYHKVLRITPEDVEILNDLAGTLMLQGDVEEAIGCYRVALHLEPDMAEIHANLGRAFEQQRNTDAAVACYEKAVELDPRHAEAWNGLGATLRQQQRLGEAMEAFRTALRIKPEYPDAQNNLGLVHTALGDLEAATTCYRKAIELDAHYTPAYGNLATSRQSGATDKDEIAHLQALVDSPKLSKLARISLHFALGKMLDDCGSYDEAFRHYQVANAGKRLTEDFDRDRYATEISQTIAMFNADRFKQRQSSGHPSELPVFIVGMPRSGTTLVEQIIASHPQVFGAGELPHIPAIAKRLPARLQTETIYPACVAMVDRQLAYSLAEDYLEKLRALSDDALRVSDKMPNNFFYLGLIALLFPNARIIHCRRDPLDVCLSIYFHRFPDGYNYAYDLTDIGVYYRQYKRLMGHWHAVLPLKICDVQYEELIANQEAVSRRLIGYCGLPWDDRCLEYYKNKRPVQTMSNWQVRQPIYTDSLQRWKNYEKHLDELKEMLAEEAHAEESRPV